MEQKPKTLFYPARRSEEVQEIINQPPQWLITWGTTILFCILILFLIASWLIHYPDIIRAPFRLTVHNAPKSILSKTDGKLVALFVKNNQSVKQQEVLGFMESTANPIQVLSLEKELNQIYDHLLKGNEDFELTRYDQLGEIQNDYQKFREQYRLFLDFQKKGYYLKKRSLLSQEMVELNRIEQNLLDQQKIYQQNYEIAKNELKIQKELARQKVIAPLELKKEESKVLEKKMPLKQIESLIYNNSNAKINKEKEILEIDKLIDVHNEVFLQSLNNFKSAIESWKKIYVLTAPISGKVYFSRFVEENQNLAANQEIFFVAPSGNNYFGEVHISQQNLGKVKVGQDVIVKFDSYPFQEFGAVKGKVAFISEITDPKNNFLIKVELPNGLRTSTGQKIIYKTGMNASAEVITRETRLLNRFFYDLKKYMKRQ